jgi:hypothetical protein
LTNLDALFDGLFLRTQAGGRELNTRLHTNLPWDNVGMVAAWKTQAELSTLAVFALVATVPIVVAYGVMLCWSLPITLVFFHIRKRGFPDLLEHSKPSLCQKKTKLVGWGTISAAKVYLAGLQDSGYTQITDRYLERTEKRWGHIRRWAFLTFGLTYFGAKVANHTLRKAGFEDKLILRLSLLGAILNTCSRVLMAAGIIKAISLTALVSDNLAEWVALVIS